MDFGVVTSAIRSKWYSVHNQQSAKVYLQSIDVFSGLLATRDLHTQAIANEPVIRDLYKRAGKTSPKPKSKVPAQLSVSQPTPHKPKKPKSSNPRCLPGLAEIETALSGGLFSTSPKSPGQGGGTASRPPKTTGQSNSQRQKKPVPRPPKKRALTPQRLGEIVQDQSRNVPYNQAKVTRWTDGQTSGALGTAELCGCTTVIVWSNRATLLTHVPETRSDIDEAGRWWPAPDMPPALQQAVIQDQKKADERFVTKARQLIQSAWNAADFPPGQTQAVIVGPYNDGSQARHRRLGVPLGPYYPGQLEGLNRMLRTDFIPRTFTGNAGSTVVEEKYISTDENSPEYQQAMLEARDVVVVNIERQGSYRNLVLYANGVDTGKYLTLGRA